MRLLIFSAWCFMLNFLPSTHADEGMWTYDNPPLDAWKTHYDFEPTQDWLDHLRLASVRFNNGGSGSFVSPHGLVMTNHHVGMDAIEKLSSESADFASDGFLAHGMEDELPCADLELNVLMSIQDVTGRVQAAALDASSDSEANEKRKGEIANIEKEESERTGLRCDVLPLYRGGQYVVYRYKKYTDVRLVMAPHASAAFFGGDFDNFTYPRYCFDYSFFRVWEDGQPIASPSFLDWKLSGVEENELVFVSGNPGSTGRLQTLSQVEFMRDVQYPITLDFLKEMVSVLEEYSALGPEQARQARGMYLSYNNGLKATTGYHQGLQNASIMRSKKQAEFELREKVKSNSELAKQIQDPWTEIESAQGLKEELALGLMYSRIRGDIASAAQRVIRLVDEIQKPNEDRLDGYRDSQLESLKLSLYSPAPIYPKFEEAIFVGQGNLMSEKLGPEHEIFKAVFGDSKVEDVAAAVSKSRLIDPEFRKELVAGGPEAVSASEDPMIVLMRRLDPIARRLAKKSEESVESIETAAGARVADARFKVFGKSVYPDATFSLRLSYGTVKGFEAEGTRVPFRTSFYGLFGRFADFAGQAPWNLPDVFLKNQGRLDMTTPLNFVCTTDIIGGNSGSPVVNRDGQLVGLIFDGNIHSLSNRFVYDEVVARSVAVDAAAIIESLEKIYGAGSLASEILGRPVR